VKIRNAEYRSTHTLKSSPPTEKKKEKRLKNQRTWGVKKFAGRGKVEKGVHIKQRLWKSQKVEKFLIKKTGKTGGQKKNISTI